MSNLFDRLSAELAAGHRQTTPDLHTDARHRPGEQSADAAVLIAVTDRAGDTGEPGVLLTQRPKTMRDHPGQVAFPGGKLEPGETAIEAALREAHEELALPPDQVRVIGPSDLYETGTGFAVTPILAVIPPDLPLVPEPGEVEAWFEPPLSLMLDTPQWSQHDWVWNGASGRYLELHFDGFRIWGVTAAIIANLALRLNAGKAALEA